MIKLDVDQAPPHDLSAELSVIGAIILDPGVIDTLTGLAADHFYDDGHRQLFDTLATMHDAGCKIDVTLLVAELKRLGRWTSVGSALIARAANGVPNTTHAQHYARIVRELACQRLMRDRGLSIIARAFQQDSRQTAEELSQLAESISVEDPSTSLKAISESCAEVASQLASQTEIGVKTGIYKLDKFTNGGLKPNQLTILAAATSVGKSAFSIQIADNAAQGGKRVLYVSLEMTAEEIVKERLLPRYYFQSSASTKDTLAQISQLPITFLDRPNLTIGNIRGFARLVAARSGLDLLIIDHIGCVSEPGANPYIRATELSRKLMTLPKELGIPVLALSQINRENSKTAKSDKMTPPRLDQLRDSGALEQDAHNVWLLHRETRLDESAELIIAKQRNGSIGLLPLNYDLKHQRFTEQQAGGDWTGKEILR
jgi:replicative DNA helicase